MKKLIVAICILSFISCGDEFENCQTCESDANSGSIITEFCQDGPNVQRRVGGVLAETILDSTVEEEVAKQEALGNVICN